MHSSHCIMALRIILWIFIALLVPAQAMKVSFYGTSYITMPLQESKMSTNIRLKFRTMQDNALIFLAAGRTDYCLLRLENGRVNLNYKIDTNLVQMLSPKRMKFSDLMWHDIAIQRYETNITMQVDEHFMRKTLHPNSTELNIHFGTFLGGAGDFSESYLGTIDYFRGCISDVYYNNINLLKRAKEKTGHAVSVDISWTCSTEFDAVAEDTISFIEVDSFMMMARSPTLEGESWAFEVRTIEPDGVLFYNSGSDFILLEIYQSKLRTIVRKGLAAVELTPDRNISDGKWHNVVVRYNAVMIEFVFDDYVTSAPFTNSSNIIIDLSKYYCFGSGCVSDATRKKIFNSSVTEMYSNFRGCMRNIAINNNLVGFPHMKATRGLAVGCVWKYPCLEKSPCILSSSCRQHGIEEFICDCDQSYCIKADYSDPYKIFAQSEYTDYEVLKINPIQLLEGEQVFLSPGYIEILFDYKKYGIFEQSITFHVVHQPKHGQLRGPASDNSPIRMFSLIDLSTDRVKYVHNGSEHFSDHMTIDLQIQEGTQRIPEYFIGKFRFVLHANITPVNDAPMLEIPESKILRVTQGVPKILRPDLLNVIDPDSNTNALLYTILNSPDNKDVSYGRFQLNGKSTLKFSQKDINDGEVTYLFDTPNSKDYLFEIPLQVSDGIETSTTIYLPVSVHPLQLRMINNTGLILIHKSSALITPWNLSVVSNSDEDNADIQYDIVQAPQYGTIQKLRTIDSSWVPISSFNSSQVILGQIRYYHSSDIPLQDEFKFTASLGPVVTQKFDFRITFTKLKIGISKQISIPIQGIRDTLISNNYLLHQTTPLPTFARNIIYTVRKPTKYGYVYVEGYPQYAKEMDSFTQLDIDKNLIHYKTYQTSYSSFIDTMEFTVSVSECDDITGSLKIVYNPEENLISKLTYQSKEKLHVQEGDRALLTRKNFEILFNTFDNLTFVVTKPAKHGSLCKYDSITEQVEFTEQFVLERLYLGDIYYCHDDSESVADSLEMLVLSDDETDFQFVSDIEIDISLVNDNQPYRQAERVFHIVKYEIRTVTAHDLSFLDNDINTNYSNIIYKHISCNNGEFYKNGRHTDSFSQDDVNNRKISFQHSGAEIGLTSFIVSDGVHEISGTLEITASEPFVRIAASNASIVQEGRHVVVRSVDLPIETNLDMKFDEIDFTITKQPAYGLLKILKTQLNISQPLKFDMSSVGNFTQLDVERERLVYWNTETASMDKIRYQVSIKNITAEGEILIRIYPAAYWEPLQVRKNQTLYVEESTSVAISRDILEVTHPNISPGDITYLITESPMHGYLEIQSVTSDDEYNCKVFDQSTINSEKMFYIQAGVNQTTDYFIFDVTNGITWLRNLILKIIIIPEVMYIKSQPVTVVEGKTVTIQTDDISPYAEYYKGKVLEYKVVKHPATGFLMVGKSQVNRFTQKQLESGIVQYVHDGSENSTDATTLVAHTRNTESPQFDLIINIIPVNDEPPIILTNTGLQVWNGGKYIIKSSDIKAQDHDSPPANLTFYIHHIYGGYLAFTSNPSAKIDQFTQQDINNGKLCFLHDADSKRNEISFVVSDGLFNTTEQILYIQAKPVTIIQLANENLHVFPMTRKQILPEQLSFKCSDETRIPKYNISLPPHLGRILYEHSDSGKTQEVSAFSQDDVDNGRILYEHTTPMSELKTNDSFVFDIVVDMTNKLHDHRFNIDISVSSGGLLRFLPVSKLTVDEGGSTPIKLDFSKILEYLKTRAGMIAPELYIESFKPSYGKILLVDGDQRANKFVPQDFVAQRVHYMHDHSDTLEDKVLMSVYLQQGNIFLCNLSIAVSINPVNDQPFHLVTPSPHVTVVEGENKTITSDDLLTTDTDTDPDHIYYEIISGPTLGVLSKKSDSGIFQDILTFANQFTQTDINDGRLVYSHYGDIKSTTFYFKVSDGVFKPAYEIFNIHIVPISIGSSAHAEPLIIQQGSNSAILTTQTVAIDTNARRNRIKYNVTNSPLSGIIIWDHQPTLHFSQSQLEKGEVSYMQTDMNKSNDTMQINAYVDGTFYGALLDIQISVEPFIKINAISIRSGDKIRLTSTLVTENPTLTKLNRYNPKIIITRTPRRGTIRKIIRNSGEIESLNNRNINTFTYKELKSGIIYFVADDLDEDEISVNDYFQYTLLIKSVQPGQSAVPIEIHTLKENALDTYETAVTAADMETLPLPYIVLILVIIALISLICVALIVVKLRFKSLNKAGREKDIPPPLPRPPDFVSLNNNGGLYSGSEDESVPVTAASTPLPGLSNIPHCKVIQVGIEPDLQDYDPEDDGLDDLGERQRMTQDRYNPYGENDEWSSSCDMANELGYSSVSQCNQSTNPLLRRNQYWV